MFTVYGDIDHLSTSLISRHRSLKAAGRAYQKGYSGNLRRILDDAGRDVTLAALDELHRSY